MVFSRVGRQAFCAAMVNGIGGLVINVLPYIVFVMLGECVPMFVYVIYALATSVFLFLGNSTTHISSCDFGGEVPTVLAAFLISSLQLAVVALLYLSVAGRWFPWN